MNIEEFVNFYFPHIKDDEKNFRTSLLQSLKEGRQLTWGRSRGDEYEKYNYSLFLTAFELLKGKTILLIGKFGERVINDLKARYEIDVISKTEKYGISIKRKV